jgi:hypothetical protein
MQATIQNGARTVFRDQYNYFLGTKTIVIIVRTVNDMVFLKSCKRFRKIFEIVSLSSLEFDTSLMVPGQSKDICPFVPRDKKILSRNARDRVRNLQQLPHHTL